MRSKSSWAMRVSLTTDVWSCSSNDTSLLSFTFHWINKAGFLLCYMLKYYHTGEYIAGRIFSMLESHRNVCTWWLVTMPVTWWRLCKMLTWHTSVVSLTHYSLLWRIGGWSIISESYCIADITAICRSIVGHFHWSSTASHSLTRVQENLNLPKLIFFYLFYLIALWCN